MGIARLRGFGAGWPKSDDAGATCDVVADLDEQLGITRQPEVGTRAKTHEADTLAPGYAIAWLFPADYPTGD